MRMESECKITARILRGPLCRYSAPCGVARAFFLWFSVLGSSNL